VIAVTASAVLADGAVVVAAAGLADLVRRLWPVRRKPTGPLAAALTGLAALALASTDRPATSVLAGVLLTGLVAGMLVARARLSWSAVLAHGWSGLRPWRRLPAPPNHLYIWVDGVVGAGMAAFIARQDLAACLMVALMGLVVPFGRSVWLNSS
jgi:hypothetical protein